MLSLARRPAAPGSSRIEAFLECAGNGRTRFEPVPPGTPGATMPSGTPSGRVFRSAGVLDLASVNQDTVDVVSQGADFPEMRRGLPLPSRRDPECWSSGYEWRAATSGSRRSGASAGAGLGRHRVDQMAGRLEVIDHAFDGFWNTDNYVIWDERGDPIAPGGRNATEVADRRSGRWSLALTAVSFAISGWAWSGYGPIQFVEVSTDGGGTGCR